MRRSYGKGSKRRPRIYMAPYARMMHNLAHARTNADKALDRAALQRFHDEHNALISESESEHDSDKENSDIKPVSPPITAYEKLMNSMRMQKLNNDMKKLKVKQVLGTLSVKPSNNAALSSLDCLYD